MNMNEKEKEKYIYAYKNGTTTNPNKSYGFNNWGMNLYSYLKKIKINSILDVGCGQGKFINDMKNKFKIKNVYGLDIASVYTNKHIQNNEIIWIDSQAHDIPLNDNSIEYIVSFDTLEHCLEKDIDNIVNEFYRVSSKGLFLRISYRQATEKSLLNNENLHMTVKNEEWWIDKFEKKFKFVKKIEEHYLYFEKNTLFNS